MTSVVVIGIFLWTLLATVASEPEDTFKERISILKCCRFSENLVKENENSTPKCVPTSSQWKPFIYSLETGKKIKEIPNKWNISEGQKPQCPKSHVLSYVPYNSYSPFILTDTGGAILELGAGRHLNPEEYCADSNALLVCELNYMDDERAASTMRPSIRRCCGSHAAYDENRYLLIASCYSSLLLQYISLEFNPKHDRELHVYTYKLPQFVKQILFALRMRFKF